MAELRDQLATSLSGTYTIEKELGGGGMSRVFLAEESRLRRKVVVKVLSPELAAGISADRFEREIQLAASLMQANIVPLLSTGETHGLPYYTMPYVEGESLRSHIGRRGGVAADAVPGIIRDVARALAYAHERGVVHRDIKPDNVLLSGGAAVVTDFGIAKAIADARGPAGATLTQFGTSIGTPAYMAPEQAAGDPLVDHRADIYALGCMAYELLSGQPPFAGRTPQRMLAAHMGEEPKPLLEVAPLTVPALAALVMACLEKDPNARPQSAQDVIRALDAVASGTSHETLTTSLLARPGLLKWALAIYIAAFIVVAVLAKAAIVGIGLPDWVLPGAMIVMGLGLPVLLFTGYAQSAVRKVALATPTYTPGGQRTRSSGTMAEIAVKASPHLTWRRAAIGGAGALGLFVVAIGTFMVLRSAGIGPFGSLLAAGRLGDARILIGDFRTTSTDSALGNVVAEAVRADLAQSSALTIVQPSVVAAQLRTMRKPAGTRLDTAVAREVAVRAGIPAFVTGDITGLGDGFVVNVRLIGADSGQALASFSEMADSPQDLIPTIGKITRQLRAKAGESLKHLQASPKLADATTSSLDALRRFTDAQVAFRANDYARAIRLFEEAIAIDSQFASAYRGAATAIGNIGSDREREMRYAKRAFDLSDRLPEVERLQTRAMYFTRTDPRAAVAEYEAMHRLRPTSSTPLNNMSNVEADLRQFDAAERHLRLAIAVDTTQALGYSNLIGLLLELGRFAAADSITELMRRRFPAHPLTGRVMTIGATARQEFDSAAALLTSSMRPELDPSMRLTIGTYLATTQAILGRLRASERDYAATTEAGRQTDNSGSNLPFELAFRGAIATWYRGERAAGVKLIDSAVVESRKISPQNRPNEMIGLAYGLAGEPAKARVQLAEHRQNPARLPWAWALQIEHSLESLIAYSERRYADGIRQAKLADTGSCLGCALPFLAMNYDMAGQPDSAIAVYQRYVRLPSAMQPRLMIDAFFLAGSHKRLGELLDAKGDAKGAVESYERVLRLWKNADPALQPQVTDVRKRIDRLRRTGG